MRRHGITGLVFMIICLGILFWLITSPVRAQQDPAVSKKLDQIINNQQEILSQLNVMKEELVKIKYRTR